MKDQRTSYGAEDKCSLVQHTCTCIDIDHLSCEKKTRPICLVLVGLTTGCQAGRQAEKHEYILKLLKF